MNGLVFFFVAATLGAPQIESTTLSGTEQVGEIARLNASSLTVKNGDKEVDVPIAEILEIRFPQATTYTVERSRARDMET